MALIVTINAALMQRQSLADCPQALGVLNAPEHWRVIEFISDLHLHAAAPHTFAAWQEYMASLKADALFILGDLFEVWVGDDVAHSVSFEADCARVLRTKAERCDVYFMPGNRDFLVGEAFSQSAGFTLLPDPTLLCWSGQRWVLSHGDALCLDDVDYQRFRNEVRSQAWRSEFLGRPLNKRLALAKHLREQSQSRQRDIRASGQGYADVDTEAALELLITAESTTLIHGHTHRPGSHALGHGCLRTVLSDWDLADQPPRADALRLTRLDNTPQPQFSLERVTLA